MWLCSAVGRCPRRWLFQTVGSWRVFMSLISLHSTQPLELIMAVLLSILQGNTCTAKDDCQGWLVSTHPPFLVSIVKTQGFDMLRAGWGYDCSPMSDTALNDSLFFESAIVAQDPAYLSSGLCFSRVDFQISDIEVWVITYLVYFSGWLVGARSYVRLTFF